MCVGREEEGKEAEVVARLVSGSRGEEEEGVEAGIVQGWIISSGIGVSIVRRESRA